MESKEAERALENAASEGRVRMDGCVVRVVTEKGEVTVVPPHVTGYTPRDGERVVFAGYRRTDS